MSYVSSDRYGMRGLGDSTPEIEQKANQILNAIGALTTKDIKPDIGTVEPLKFLLNTIDFVTTGNPPPPALNYDDLRFWQPHTCPGCAQPFSRAQVHAKIQAIQQEFMAFLLAAGYPEGSARHMAAFTSLAQPRSVLGGDKLAWTHAWGTGPLSDGLNSTELATYDALRIAIFPNMAPWRHIHMVRPDGLWTWWWAPTIPVSSAANDAYARMLDFVLQKLLAMLRSTSRESAADLAIKAGINGKFQQLLGRASTQQEIDAWFPQIKAGTKTLDDLDAYIRSMVEYTQKHPGGTNGKKDDKKEAGTGLDFLKSPWVWVAAAAAGGFYYWTQVKNKSMGQLPYVGKYLKGR